MYLTYRMISKNQNSFEDIFKALLNHQAVQSKINEANNTRTLMITNEVAEHINLYHRYNVDKMINKLTTLANKFNKLPYPTNAMYTHFDIPKSSGGFRTISAPIDDLKFLLKEALKVFEYNLHLLPSDKCYAFTRKRNTLQAVKQHQQNESNWFLKMDIQDFFSSCTFDFIMTTLEDIFPFNYILKSEEGKRALETIIKYSLLDGGLPQGSPLSPIISNTCMIPFDYHIKQQLDHKMIYTRYADDILISSYYIFKWQDIQQKTINLLQPTFNIKQSKTHFGARRGKNWNLGLMLNKDNNITVGWRQKRAIKSTIYKALKFDNLDDKEKQRLKGLLAYYRSIEPGYFQYIINKYSTKFNTNLIEYLG